MEYRISTIIPVYNCENFLERAVESVIKQQEFSCVQLILVDDGSTDSSPEICDRYASEYPNIYAYHQENSGVSAARNLGISKADAELITFIDSDDYILEGYYENIFSNSDSDLVCFNYTNNISVKTNLSHYFFLKHYNKHEFSDSLYPAMADDYTMYQCWNKVYRKSIIEKYALQFPVGVKLAEDMIFVYSYIEHIESFRYIDKSLYFYYINESSVTGSLKYGYEAYEMIYNFLSEYFNRIGYKTYNVHHNFVFRSVGTIYSAAVSLSFFDAYKYINKILNKTVFYRKYCEDPIYKKCDGVNGYMNKFIMKKSPFLIILLVRYNELRSARIQKKENKNG